MRISDWAAVILKGFSQVMLQSNTVTGALFLAGIFINSWLLGLAALMGAACSTLTAISLKYDEADVRDGLYGFNGVLVGIALTFIFGFSPTIVGLMLLGSGLSSVVMNLMQKRGWPPYTFPFVVSTWLSLALIDLFGLASQETGTRLDGGNLDVFSSVTLGFGQVMFQASAVTGVIFAAALLVNSRRSALYALMGSLTGMVVSSGLSLPVNLVNSGLFGYNGVLCALAFADKKSGSIVYALVSIVFSVFIMSGMASLEIAALTSPFVLATWAASGLRTLRKR